MKLIINILFAGLLVCGFSSCDSYLDKLENPNLVTTPPINGLLATATYQSGLNVYRMGNIVSYYTQYLSSNVRGSDADIYNEVDYSSSWSNFYNAMMNIHQMNTMAAERGASKHLGVGKILMALNLNMLINAFGDVPYTEALQGQQLLLPKFDGQESLHTVCLQLLDEGIVELRKTDATLNLDGASDVIHGGNVDAWIRTGYGLKARFLNQLSKTTAYDPAAVLAALANSYTVSSQDAALTSFEQRSPWNEAAFNNTQLNLDGWLSTQFVDALNGTTFSVFDPRLPKIATITKFGDYRGTTNGAGRIGTGTNQEESYLSVDGFYSRSAAPVWILTFSELKFIEAEAAFRSGNKQRAYEAYMGGIKENMTKLGVSDGDMRAYMESPVVASGQANISLDLIFKEKYVAMFLNPETWTDARRFDYKYKDFSLPTGAAMSTFIRRIAYPTVEISRNGANVPEISGLDERLFWDK